MITADHGPSSTLDFNLIAAELDTETILERMKILSAYRLPGCDESFRSDLTPVNGVRIATNCALGVGLSEVLDHNFWAVSRTEPVVSVKSVLDSETPP